MARDALGHHVTTSNAQTIAAIDVYTEDWIGYGPRLRTIIEAADADPGCAFANAKAAALHMALEATSGFAAARPYLARALEHASCTSEREQSFVAAVEAWSHGDVASALTMLRRLVRDNPGDIAAAKWAQYHAFNLGDAEAMRAIARDVMPAHEHTPEAWGMLAFGLEQCHDLDAAEEAGRRALSLKQTEPWAQHAIAHVMETQGRIEEGACFLKSRSHAWSDRGVFIREHNFWHLALFYLDLDEPKKALQVFDEQLWGPWPEFAQEQIGAISALWRLELRGVDIGDRWTPVVKQVLARRHEHILPFHDLHFLYALSRGGYTKETNDFLTSLSSHGDKDPGGVWAQVAVPLAQGLVAYTRGKHDTAANFLASQLPHLSRIGGSHAQRDVFTQTWIDAALNAHQFSAAEDLLSQRDAARPGVASTQRWLDRARAGRRSTTTHKISKLRLPVPRDHGYIVSRNGVG